MWDFSKFADFSKKADFYKLQDFSNEILCKLCIVYYKTDCEISLEDNMEFSKLMPCVTGLTDGTTP